VKALVKAGVVGATGFEPATSSVSGHARPFTRYIAALHGTTSALLRRATEPGTAVRYEAAHGIAADKLLTGGRDLDSVLSNISSSEDRWLIAAPSAGPRRGPSARWRVSSRC
jgi:hypothetical protein